MKYQSYKVLNQNKMKHIDNDIKVSDYVESYSYSMNKIILQYAISRLIKALGTSAARNLIIMMLISKYFYIQFNDTDFPTEVTLTLSVDKHPVLYGVIENET